MKTKQNKTIQKKKKKKKLQNVIGATAHLRGLPWAYFGFVWWALGLFPRLSDSTSACYAHSLRVNGWEDLT